MKIDCVIVGEYQTNCYILRADSEAKQCLLIDAGLEPSGLIGFLEKELLNPVAIVLTHGHIDHTAAVSVLRSRYPQMKVYIHKLDADMLTGKRDNLSLLAGVEINTESADVLLEEGDIIEQAGIKLAVLHTPGHTPGGICLHSQQDGAAFVGDTLFAGSVGRTDFAGGSMTELVGSIKKKLFSLPDETVIYPGHGSGSTIAEEKAHNPFVR